MSKLADWAQLNLPEQAAPFQPSDFCQPVRPLRRSAIDEFYDYQRSVLLSGDPNVIAGQPVLGRVLLLAMVSGVESYFRHVLAGAIDSCQICRRVAGELQVSLSAVDYYDAHEIGMGCFEHVSFASEGEVEKQTRRATKLELNTSSSAKVAVKSFEKLAHLRHAAVHSSGNLNSRNLGALEMHSGLGALQVSVPFSALHQAAQVCLTVVRAYNTFLYRGLLTRWSKVGLMRFDWKADREAFTKAFSVFRSKVDKPNDAPHRAYLRYVRWAAKGTASPSGS